MGIVELLTLAVGSGLGWLAGRAGGSNDRGLLRESLRDAEADLDAADRLNRCLVDLLADAPGMAERRAQVHAAFLKRRGGA